ncbi:MAG: hypothetical protein ABJP48_03610 [Erythrobacter sp.]
MRIAAIALMAGTLAACAGAPRGPSNAVIDRALRGAPGAAQPSRIVATEIEFARAAKENGQFTAGLQFAAPLAVFHSSNGTQSAAALFGQLPNPDEPIEWGPRTVVMSCDGSLAVSLGRYEDQDDQVGNYVTVWQRQQDGGYRWIYDVAGPDIPQPPPRQEFEDGDIVVTAIDSIEGLVADCARPGQSVPPPPAVAIGSGGEDGGGISRDGTLRWRWEHRPDGIKHVKADYFYQGQWLSPIEENLTSPPEG